MSQLEKEIGEVLQDIAGVLKRKRFAIMSGKVVAGSVDADNGICSVVLSINDEDSPTEEVLINTVSLNNNGVVMYPADGSNVWVGEIDGQGKYGILRCSNLAKLSVIIGGTSVTVTDGLVKFNDGSNKGLVKLDDLVTRLNNLERDNNNLKAAFSSWIVVPNDGGAALKTIAAAWYGANLTLTTGNDIENKKVKH